MIRHVTISTVQSLPEAVTAINKGLKLLVDQINADKPSAPQSLNGQRLVDVGYPVAQNDAVTLAYLNREFKRKPRVTVRRVENTATGNAVYYGPHSTRTDGNVSEYVPGDLWVETDRDALYQVRTSTGDTVKWVFVGGRYVSTFADKPSDLTADDEGFEFNATDADHSWLWNGTAWGWAPQERLPGEIASFEAVPSVGWAICTGGTATGYTAVATTTTYDIPDMRNYFVVGGDTYVGTGVAAVDGTLSGVSVGAPSALVAIAQGTGATVNAAHSTHTHAVTGSVSDSLPPKFVVLFAKRI